MESHGQVEGIDELTQRVSQLHGVLQKKLQEDLIARTEQSGLELIAAWNVYTETRSRLPGWPPVKEAPAPWILPEPWTR